MTIPLQEDAPKPVLRCEQWSSYLLLVFIAGFFGAFTFLLRGAVFCNAQTFNFALCASALVAGDFSEFFYYFIPITAYFLGAFLSESAQGTIQKWLPIRWETLLMGIEFGAVLLLGFLPERAPHRISQVTINLIASMQYNTFRETRKVPMSTTFCTNHLRQIGINASHALFRHDREAVRRLEIHLKMVLCFFCGAFTGAFLSLRLLGRAIWVLLLPFAYLFIVFLKEDLHSAKEQTSLRPAGH